MTCENPACARDFTPKPKTATTVTRYCCLQCWHTVRGALRIAVNTFAATEARKDQAYQRRMVRYVADFGHLSKRDSAMLEAAERAAYRRGYSTGVRMGIKKMGRTT